MARRTTPIPPEGPVLLVIPRAEAIRRIDDRIAKGGEIKTRQFQDAASLAVARNDYYTWTEYNEEMLRQMFTSTKLPDEYSSSIGFVAGSQGYLDEEIRELQDDIDEKIRRLQSIRGRLELIPEAPGVAKSAQPSIIEPQDLGTVFIVHGHNEAVRESVARFVSRLNLTPVVLHEQASQGRTVVEKLEAHASVGFAIVLLTPNDVGGPDPQHLQPRARQNVVLELGYFLGRLQRNRVCAVYKGDLEIPSDYMGVIYVPFDSAGGWRLQLAKELKAAGLHVDMNKAI
jgi:predicted nucleotide-binding protein